MTAKPLPMECTSLPGCLSPSDQTPTSGCRACQPWISPTECAHDLVYGRYSSDPKIRVAWRCGCGEKTLNWYRK